MYRKLSWIFAGSLSLASCGSGTSNSAPPPVSVATVAPNAIVAAVGNTEAELQRSIDDAKAAGRTPRFVRIHTAKHDHVFSPYAQVLRTQNAIIVRGYGNIFVWKSDDATVYWSAGGPPVNDQIPVVRAAKIDAVAKGLTGDAAGKMVSWGGQLLRKHADPWAGIKDPWQIHPDYASVNPSPPIVATTGGKRGKRYYQPACSIEFGCCSQVGNSFEGCYYYYYQYYYSPWGTGPRMGNTGGGGDASPPPKTSPSNAGCPTMAQTADNAVKAMIAQYAGLMAAAPGPSNSPPGNTTEAYTYIYQNTSNHSYSYDDPKTLQISIGSGGRSERPPDQPNPFTGYRLVGFVHTHPGPSPNEESTGIDPVGTDSTYGTHFSQFDFDFAVAFEPPIAMFVAVHDTNAVGSPLAQDRFYQLNIQQNGVDANGKPVYKAAGETPASNSTSNTVSSSGC